MTWATVSYIGSIEQEFEAAATRVAGLEVAMSVAAHPVPAPTVNVRLTRRGRMVLFMTVLVAALLSCALLAGPALSIGSVHRTPTKTVVVQPGQTLWDIATRIDPTADPRDVVAEIVRLNSLTDGGSVRVGQPLAVPRR